MNNKMNNKPWLSIIVPVYNAEKYIAKCIDSVIRQSFFDFELILVDDGSTDKSSSICKYYAKTDERIRYYSKDNGGSIQARVFGVEKSIGDYFTFCDADDYYASKHAFEIIYDEIKKEKCDALQYCYVKKYNHLFKKNKIKSMYNANYDKFYNSEYPKLLCSHWQEATLTTNVWNKVYKKELKNNLPSHDLFQRIFWGDDLIINLYLLEQCNSILFIPDHLYIYRQFSGGTNQFSEQTMNDLNQIKEFQLQFIEKYQGIRKEDVINVCFMEIAGWFFLFIKQSLYAVGEIRTRELFNESIELSSFKKAREYYINNPKIENKQIMLFRNANIDEYFYEMKKDNYKESFKSIFISFLKKIYKTV